MLKLYVLIREGMTPAQQAVQAGHAVAQFGYEHRQAFVDWQNDSNTLIYLSVKSIDYWKTVLTDGDFTHSVFQEPEFPVAHYYMGQRTKLVPVDTAIAVAPNWTCQYLLFKDLPLALREVEIPRKRWWNR